MDIIIKEIKSICNDPQKVEQFLKSQNARFVGEDHQIDTYFIVPNGRLKLRQGQIEANLIHYNRIETQGVKTSSVQLFKIVEDGAKLRELLITALGLLIEVEKKRKIYFIDNVKFHVDDVQGLGSFIEIEAIGDSSTMEDQLLEQCNYYVDALGIDERDLIAQSYSDLLLSKN